VNLIARGLASARYRCEALLVRPEDVREFAARSRGPVAQAKREHWGAAAQQADGLAAFDAGQALYEHAKSLGEFPSDEYLHQDFAHHVHLKQLIDRASEALSTARAAR
jgi:hypothetical protein